MARGRARPTCPPGETVEGERYVIKCRTVPAPVAVQVDAVMPEHRHGMNYKADVKVMVSGRHRAEGLLFHMPGRWEFLFDVQAGGKPHRLVNSMVLR